MSLPRIAVLGLLALASPALAQPALPGPAEMGRSVSAEATVEAVNRATREVTLRMPDGERETFAIGPEVRNLDRVRRGDRVVAQMSGAVSLALAEPGTTSRPMAALGAQRREPGQRPGAGVGAAAGFRAKVIALNPQTGRVTFEGPGGQMRSILVRSPELRAFVARLAPGDEVDVGVAEIASLTVEPRGRR